MDVAKLFTGRSEGGRLARKRSGRPPLYNDPVHVGRRAYAIEAVKSGEPRKQVAARMGIALVTLWRWETGKIGPGRRAS